MRAMIAGTRFMYELLGLWLAGGDSYRHSPQLQRLDVLRRAVWLGTFAIAACALLTYPLDAGAIEVFDRLERAAADQQTSWFTRIRDLAEPTFLILGTIEICWAAAIWVFERDTLSSFAVEVIKKIMTIGFFFVLLDKAPEWIPTIMRTFEDVGLEASNLDEELASEGERLSTDFILTRGIDVAIRIWTSTKTFAIAMMAVPLTLFGSTVPLAPAAHEYARGVVTVAAIGAVIIVAAYVIVAAQFFCLKVESAILLAAGAIFLGMGSSSWTRDYVSKYLNYAINVGVRMLVLILILSLTLRPASGMGGGEIEMQPILEVVCVSILQAILAIKAPELAGALLSGGAGLTAGGASGAMGGMVRSMASGAMAAVNTAKGMGNLAKAASAGRTNGAGQPGAMSGAGGPAGAQGKPNSGSTIAGLGGSGAGGAPNASNGPGNAGGRGSPPSRLADAAGQNRNNASGSVSPGNALQIAPASSAPGLASAAEDTSAGSTSSVSHTESEADRDSVDNDRASLASISTPTLSGGERSSLPESNEPRTLWSSSSSPPSTGRAEPLRKGSTPATPGPQEPNPRSQR